MTGATSPGPPLLLVHGAFCGAWAWEALRRPWERAGHACVALDLPGHAPGDRAMAVAGRSLRDYADAVVEAARALPGAPVIVGHSMGGLVAQIAAARTPVAGLVLLAPSPAWGQTESAGMEFAAGLALTALRGPWWLQALEPEWPVVRQFTMDRLPGPEARALFARMVAESGRAVFEITNWWLDPTFAAAAPTLDLPALVLVGEHDQVNPPEVARATARRLRAEHRVLPGRSHWLLGDDSGEDGVCEAVLAWLGG
ncbi:MAG: alpha/beta fold hydrolase, partial [Caulobacteraceae bacterium]|nr:alpha/beta fold hydrolase [Caulobacter sp.]